MVDLNHNVPINASPDKVYAAVATEAGMRNWWTRDTQMEERVGGKAVFSFDNRSVIFRMTIDRLEPGRRVIMSCQGNPPDWNGTKLTWEIAPGEGGSATLKFTHAGWREMNDNCIGCNSMWGNLMFRLKDFVEGNSRGPQWT
jgi:uncharacterized protein YndB with AHSA1/START domain